MEDTSFTELRNEALALGRLLKTHNAGQLMVLDLTGLNAWTDFFVIATATSTTHMGGLQRHILEYCAERNLEILHSKGKSALDPEWNLVDMGSIVIHLMSSHAREFYELERLWASAKNLIVE